MPPPRGVPPVGLDILKFLWYTPYNRRAGPMDDFDIDFYHEWLREREAEIDLETRDRDMEDR
jgi:hypothetical protein